MENKLKYGTPGALSRRTIEGQPAGRHLDMQKRDERAQFIADVNRKLARVPRRKARS